MRHRQGPVVGRKDRFDLGEPRVLSGSAVMVAPGPCLKPALLQIRRSIRLLCEPIGSRNQFELPYSFHLPALHADTLTLPHLSIAFGSFFAIEPRAMPGTRERVEERIRIQEFPRCTYAVLRPCKNTQSEGTAESDRRQDI